MLKIHSYLPLVLVSIMACTTKPTEQKNNPPLSSNLDAYIYQLIDQYHIGGAIGIGIVKDGMVVNEKVYGYIDYNNKIPADSDTKFYIASMTKSFVGTLARILENRGELLLDSTLDTYLSHNFFQDIATDEITLGDLLCHTSGLNNSAVSYKTSFTGNFTNDEIINDLRNETYQHGQDNFNYTNLGYILYGIILEKLTDKSWKDHLRDELLTPLEMTNTSAYLASVYSKTDNGKLALPHSFVNGQIETGKFLKRDDTMHAAGGLITTVADMNKWLLAHLDQSTDGQVTAKELEDIHTDRIGLYSKNAGINSYGYGLGWMQGDWSEFDISWHSGSYPGYVSVHALIREENLGVVIMMSQQSRAIELILNYILADQLKVDSKKNLIKLEKQIQYRIDQYRHFRDSLYRSTVEVDIQKLDLEKFTGIYKNKNVSTLYISAINNQLLVEWGNLQFRGEYLGDDKFLMKSEVNDTYGVADFYHIQSKQRSPYLEMFGEKFHKWSNN